MSPRSLVALMLCALVVLPLHPAAARPDPAEDDDFLIGNWEHSRPLGCHDPRIDVVALDGASDGTHVTIRLEVADLQGDAHCRGVALPGQRGFQNYEIYSPGPYTMFAVKYRVSYPVLSSFAPQVDACGRLYVSDGSGFGWADTGCIGTFAVDGDAITWTFPIAAEADPETRRFAYNVSGERFWPYCFTTSSVNRLYFTDECGEDPFVA